MSTEYLNRLKDYLEYAGIITCNVNPYLPSLSDIGFSWTDATALIDSHELFYCKAYRKRTTYLSNSVYFLLKQCKNKKLMPYDATIIYDAIRQSGPLFMTELKLLTRMESSIFSKAFNFLLENMYITAYKNGEFLNSNWSTLVYCTAEKWEKCVDIPTIKEEPHKELKIILTRTMPEKEFEKFIK
jgi:hypothetical protein